MNKQNKPLVSVVMATYNRAGYLNRSISSFLNQSFTDAELIVVDDGSDDHTFWIVSMFMKDHNNIRYLRQAHRGVSQTKNTGIKAATGKYIAFLDSDDAYKPGYLESRVRFMEANPEVDLVEGGEIIIGDPYVKDKNQPDKKIHLSECHIGATFFGKSEVFTAVGGFDDTMSYAEDSDFWERAEKNFRVRKIEHPGYVYYHQTPGSLSNRV